MGRIDGKAFRLLLPALTDGLIRGKALLTRFEPRHDSRGHQERLQMFFDGVMGCVVIPCHGGLFARTGPPCPWAIGPGMVGVGAARGTPMSTTRGTPMSTTDASKDLVKGLASARPLGHLEAVIGESRGDRIGYGSAPVPEALRGNQFGGFRMPCGLGKRAGARHRDTQLELPCGRADLCDVGSPRKVVTMCVPCPAKRCRGARTARWHRHG
jgi:hypothetical protein